MALEYSKVPPKPKEDSRPTISVGSSSKNSTIYRSKILKNNNTTIKTIQLYSIYTVLDINNLEMI